MSDQLHQSALQSILGGMRPVASHDVGEDAQLGSWMQQRGVPPEDLSVYDMLGAMKSGAEPDAGGHWPSQFKRANHPNRVVGGFDTTTGARVPGAKLARSVQELIALGWEPKTAQQLWTQVQK